jgi:hypothetical protein
MGEHERTVLRAVALDALIDKALDGRQVAFTEPTSVEAPQVGAVRLTDVDLGGVFWKQFQKAAIPKQRPILEIEGASSNAEAIKRLGDCP